MNYPWHCLSLSLQKYQRFGVTYCKLHCLLSRHLVYARYSPSFFELRNRLTLPEKAECTGAPSSLDYESSYCCLLEMSGPHVVPHHSVSLSLIPTFIKLLCSSRYADYSLNIRLSITNMILPGAEAAQAKRSSSQRAKASSIGSTTKRNPKCVKSVLELFPWHASHLKRQFMTRHHDRTRGTLGRELEEHASWCLTINPVSSKFRVQTSILVLTDADEAIVFFMHEHGAENVSFVVCLSLLECELLSKVAHLGSGAKVVSEIATTRAAVGKVRSTSRVDMQLHLYVHNVLAPPNATSFMTTQLKSH
ncbi:hypothetical protein CERZMDRAFT_94369 [Cercospora zeae-maydis SCOH1-5]|uniref:Uncharacterized protein n=1 Tax=Cercospora zeae-maydis SCOH1-5 TaxID=717836 RepID=A0A6A6FRS4_9PEZI|nr:hypothetical protein CERZMDRAFT_94369 [Cercospora zeae-maydis SCOH1-5]